MAQSKSLKQRLVGFGVAGITLLAALYLTSSPAYAGGFFDVPQQSNTDYYGGLGKITYTSYGGGSYYITGSKDTLYISGSTIPATTYLEAQDPLVVEQPHYNYPSSTGTEQSAPSYSYMSTQDGYIVTYTEQGSSIDNGYNLMFAPNENGYINVFGGDLSYVKDHSPSATLTDQSTGQSTTVYDLRDIQTHSDARELGTQIVSDPYNSGYYQNKMYFEDAPAPWANVIVPSTATAGNSVSINLESYLASWYTTMHYSAVQVTGPNGYSAWLLGSGTSYSQMATASGGDSVDTSGTIANPTHPNFQESTQSLSWNTTGLTTGTYTFHFYLRDGTGRAAEDFGNAEASLSLGTGTPPVVTPTPSISLSASTLTPPNYQTITLWASAQNVPTGGWVTIHDRYSGTDFTGTTWTPPETSGTDFFTAYIHDSSGNVVATSNEVEIVWGVGQSPATMTLSITGTAGSMWMGSSYYPYQTLNHQVTATVTWTNGRIGDWIFIWNNQMSNWWNQSAVVYVGQVTPNTVNGSATVTFTETGTGATDSWWPGPVGYEAVMENALTAPPYNFDSGSNTVLMMWIPPQTSPVVTATNPINGQSSTTSLVVPIGTAVQFHYHQDWALTGWSNNAPDPWPGSGVYIQGVDAGIFNLDQINTNKVGSSTLSWYQEVGPSGPFGMSYVNWNTTYDHYYAPSYSYSYQRTGTQDYLSAQVLDPSMTYTSSVPYTAHFQAEYIWHERNYGYSYYYNFGDGDRVLPGNTVTVVWASPVTVSLQASPTSLPIKNYSTITASIQGALFSGAYIEIKDTTTGQVVGDGNVGQSTFSANVTSSAVSTHNYTAYVLNSNQPGVTYATSSPVSVTWTLPTLTLSASPTNLAATYATTLFTSESGGQIPNTYLVIQDTSTGSIVGTSSVGDATLASNYARSTQGTEYFQAEIVDNDTGQIYVTSNSVAVTWTQPPLTLSGADVYHTPQWQINLNTWNQEYPSQQRTQSEFWAGEAFLFKIQSSITTVTSANVTLTGLQYDPYVPSGAPSVPIQIPLTYNSSDGYLEGSTDYSWSTWFQYLEPGTVTATFTVSAQGQVQSTQVQFQINGKWTDFWKDAQVY